MYQDISALRRDLATGQVSALALLSQCVALNLDFQWHPLGFIVCTFLRQESIKVRLHLWPAVGAKQQSSDCLIHDHVFEFTSWVLKGTIENVEYTVDQEGDQYSIYEASSPDNTSVLTKTSRKIDLRVERRKKYHAGTNYTIRAGQLHETILVSSESAATVLITNDVSSGSPVVVGKRTGANRYEYERTRLSYEELAWFVDGI